MSDGPVRHVWVNVDGRAVAGLLIAWQRTEHGWSALVTYVAGEDRAVTKLVDQSSVTPGQVMRPGPGFAAYGQVL